MHKPSFEGRRIKLGPYGFIKGSQYSVTGTVGRVAFAEEDYGYLFEGIILQLLDMGLGDRCLGGTFKRSGWAQALNMPSGMIIPAITLVGYPAPTMSNRERLAVSALNRQPWMIVQEGENFHFFLSRTPGYGIYCQMNTGTLRRLKYSGSP